MPKKISDITYRPEPPQSEKQKILKHLQESPDDGFTTVEVGRACGILPHIDSFSALGGLILGALVGRAASGSVPDVYPVKRVEALLEELRVDGLIDQESDSEGEAYWFIKKR